MPALKKLHGLIACACNPGAVDWGVEPGRGVAKRISCDYQGVHDLDEQSSSAALKGQRPVLSQQARYAVAAAPRFGLRG